MAAAVLLIDASASTADAAWRTGNVGRLMFAATDRFVRDQLREGGVVLPSDAMLALFVNLDGAGTRLTVLAARAGQAKQSMIELVDKAAALNLVERRADPDDLRARRVCFTPAGLAILERLERGTVVAERRFAAVVGADCVAALKERLAAYVAAVGDDDAWSAADASLAPQRQRNAGRYLALAAHCFARDLLGVVHRRGWSQVSDVLLALFRHLDLDGTRLTDLAARARMTKQSMRELVDRAQALGLVDRHPDPADRRAKIVAFTRDGRVMLDAVRDGVAAAEARFGSAVGAAFAADLKARLRAYLAAAQAISSAELPSTGSAEGSTSGNSAG